MRRWLAALALGLALAAPALAQQAPRGPGCPALPRSFPMPREASAEEIAHDEWRQRRRRLDQRLAETDRSQAQLVFIGDSITESWDPALWQQFHGHRRALNLGLWGDFTQGALWRLANGQWQGLRPRLAVLLIGTNNLAWGQRPADIAMGIAELVRLIQERSPGTRVLILGLLPRGAGPEEPLRAAAAEVNRLVARCADGEHTHVLDLGRLLLDGEGRFPDHLSGDKLHLTATGYALLAAGMEPLLRRLLGEAP